MRIVLAAVGRLKTSPEAVLVAHYLRRAEQTGARLGLRVGPAMEISESGLGAAGRDREAAAMLASLPAGAVCVALDEHGEAATSRAFAARLAQWRDSGAGCVALCIGGADGHGAPVLAQARWRWSLGRITLPHGLARVVLAEQVYRAVTILAGHPYHRD